MTMKKEIEELRSDYEELRIHRDMVLRNLWTFSNPTCMSMAFSSTEKVIGALRTEIARCDRRLYNITIMMVRACQS